MNVHLLGFLLEINLTPEFNPQITDISLESFFFMLLLFSRSLVSNSSANPWSVVCQAPPSVHGISQARILGWVAISFCWGSS